MYFRTEVTFKNIYIQLFVSPLNIVEKQNTVLLFNFSTIFKRPFDKPLTIGFVTKIIFRFFMAGFSLKRFTIYNSFIASTIVFDRNRQYIYCFTKRNAVYRFLFQILLNYIE